MLTFYYNNLRESHNALFWDSKHIHPMASYKIFAVYFWEFQPVNDSILCIWFSGSCATYIYVIFYIIYSDRSYRFPDGVGHLLASQFQFRSWWRGFRTGNDGQSEYQSRGCQQVIKWTLISSLHIRLRSDTSIDWRCFDRVNYASSQTFKDFFPS